MQIEDFYAKLAINDKNRYFPYFDVKNTIIDTTDEGYKLTLADYTQIDINEVAYAILHLCNGKLSINQIIDEITKMYDAPINIIEKDIVKILYSFWVSSVISWINNENYYSVLYEEKTGDYTFRVPTVKEFLQLLSERKDKVLFDVRYNPEIKFTSAYIEKDMHIKNMRFFECKKAGNELIFFSLVPIVSFANGKKEVISFAIDAIYVDDQKQEAVKEIQDRFFKWTLNWFDNVNINNSNVCLVSVNNKYDKRKLEALSFSPIKDCASKEQFYERII